MRGRRGRQHLIALKREAHIAKLEDLASQRQALAEEQNQLRIAQLAQEKAEAAALAAERAQQELRLQQELAAARIQARVRGQLARSTVSIQLQEARVRSDVSRSSPADRHSETIVCIVGSARRATRERVEGTGCHSNSSWHSFKSRSKKHSQPPQAPSSRCQGDPS